MDYDKLKTILPFGGETAYNTIPTLADTTGKAVVDGTYWILTNN